MGLLTIATCAVLGAAALPTAGLLLGISAVGPVAGGVYASLQSAGFILPAVQSTLMTVGAGAVAKTTVVGAIAGLLI